MYKFENKLFDPESKYVCNLSPDYCDFLRPYIFFYANKCRFLFTRLFNQVLLNYRPWR